MSSKPAADPATPAPKGKKKLFVILGVVVLVLALAAGGGWYYVMKQRAAAAAEEDGDEPVAEVVAQGPPTYLPLDNMIVNLADPGGEKVAQVGITLEVADAHSVDSVKVYLPTIRSSILILLSQRTSEELLQREGKEKLAADVLREASKPFGGVADAHGEAKPAKAKKKTDKNAHAANPVRGVLFSSFIIQ